jgi:hypothetical protein
VVNSGYQSRDLLCRSKVRSGDLLPKSSTQDVRRLTSLPSRRFFSGPTHFGFLSLRVVVLGGISLTGSHTNIVPSTLSLGYIYVMSHIEPSPRYLLYLGTPNINLCSHVLRREVLSHILGTKQSCPGTSSNRLTSDEKLSLLGLSSGVDHSAPHLH